MPNLMDYIAWRGDLPFSASPFCDVDAMILAQLAYIDFSGVAPDTPGPGGVLLNEAARSLLARPDNAAFGVMYDKNRALLLALSRSPRYGIVRLSGIQSAFDPVRALQFAALTATLPDHTAALCFRGTDSTLTGWKEDLNMSYLCPVPAQELAALYLARAARALALPLRVVGHSKGGNLALYASAFCPEDIQRHILGVYSLDGPGLPVERLRDPGYLAVRERFHLLVPRTSIVGMLLAHDARHTVVRSDALLTRQHSLYSWQVLGASPMMEQEPDAASRYINETIDAWLQTLSAEDRARFIDALFELLTASGASTLKELSSSPGSWAPAMAAAFTRLDTPSRTILIEGVKRLAAAALANAPQPPKPQA